MTPAGLGRMRCAAALVHGASGVGLRLRHDGRVRLHVDRWEGTDRGRIPWMAPCAFRAAVARAHRDLLQGRALSVLGLPQGTDPAVDVCAAPGSQVHPGPVVRSVAEGSVVTAFATLLAPDEARAVVCASGELGDLDGVEAHLHVDTLLDVTVVAVEQPADVPAEQQARAMDAVADLLVACSMASLLAELAPLGDGLSSSRERP